MLETLSESFRSDPSWTSVIFTPSAALLRCGLIVVAATVLSGLLRWACQRGLGPRYSPHHVDLARQVVAYGVWGSATLLGMREFGFDLRTLSTSARSLALMRVAFILFVASVLAPLARRGLVGVAGRRWSPQQAVLSRRAATYLVWGLASLTALSELGFDLRYLLGTAGFAGIALTYSGQTSLSNIITGLFLIAEQPFVIGDTITVNGITGEVLSVDLLSIKLRTADNLFVRLPNESVLRNTVTNVSHFPIRRLDITLQVGYGESMGRVQQALFEIAAKNPLGLEDPKPIFQFVGFGDSGVNLQFSVWGRKETFLDLKNSMHATIKEVFAQRNIEIPYPYRALVPGAGQQALPVALPGQAREGAGASLS